MHLDAKWAFGALGVVVCALASIVWAQVEENEKEVMEIREEISDLKVLHGKQDVYNERLLDLIQVQRGLEPPERVDDE